MYDAPIRDGNGSLHPLLHHLSANKQRGTLGMRFQNLTVPALVPTFA